MEGRRNPDAHQFWVHGVLRHTLAELRLLELRTVLLRGAFFRYPVEEELSIEEMEARGHTGLVDEVRGEFLTNLLLVREMIVGRGGVPNKILSLIDLLRVGWLGGRSRSGGGWREIGG